MTRTEANYLTAGGNRITVESYTDTDHHFYDGEEFEAYAWTCPGCGAEKPYGARTRQEALKTASDHASVCQALNTEGQQ